MSVYKGELTPRFTAICIKKLQESFPALPEGFYSVFMDRLAANSYCDERLNDAINHVIDNCVYPTPTIAQFISFGKKIKLYDYRQYMKLVDEFRERTGSLYKAVRIGGNERPVYASMNDIKEYNLELWNKTK